MSLIKETASKEVQAESPDLVPERNATMAAALISLMEAQAVYKTSDTAFRDVLMTLSGAGPYNR